MLQNRDIHRMLANSVRNIGNYNCSLHQLLTTTGETVVNTEVDMQLLCDIYVDQS